MDADCQDHKVFKPAFFFFIHKFNKHPFEPAITDVCVGISYQQIFLLLSITVFNKYGGNDDEFLRFNIQIYLFVFEKLKK